MNTNNQQKKEPKTPLRIPLEFEETLEAMMQIKPVENTDLKKPKRAKKKSKPKK